VKLDWTDRSLSDLQKIQSFIAQDSVHISTNFIADLIHATDILLTSPRVGRIVPEIANESIRELIFRNYRIVYKNDRDTISILTVFEGHKLLSSFSS